MQVRMFPGEHEKGGGHRMVGGEWAWMGWEWLAAGGGIEVLCMGRCCHCCGLEWG